MWDYTDDEMKYNRNIIIATCTVTIVIYNNNANVNVLESHLCESFLVKHSPLAASQHKAT